MTRVHVKANVDITVFITLPPVGVQSIAISMCVCPHLQARSLRYVLPVLRMTPCFQITEGIDQVKDDALFRPVRQMAAPVGRPATFFGRDHRVAVSGAKSAVTRWHKKPGPLATVSQKVPVHTVE